MSEVVRANPALRISVDRSEPGEPGQFVHRIVDASLEVHPQTGRSPEVCDEVLRRIVERETARPFDITTPPLLRFVAQALDESRFRLVVVAHPVVLDSWGDERMRHELRTTYRQHRDGVATVAAPTARHRELVLAERAAAGDQAALRHWDEEFSAVDAGPLPAPAAPGGQNTGSRVSVRLPVAARLREVADAHELSVAHVLIAAHLRVLGSVTASSAVRTAVATPVVPGGEEVVGRWVEPLPLGVELRDLSWTDLAHEVARWERAAVPFVPIGCRDLVERNPESLSDNRVSVVIARGRAEDVTVVEPGGHTGFGLHVCWTVGVDGADVVLDVEVDRRLVHPAVAVRLPGYCERALTSFLADPSAQVSAADLRSREDVEELGTWRAGPVVPVEELRPMPESFWEHVRRRPDAPAVHDIAESLTYAQLGRRVAGMAGRLRERGLGPGDRIGLCLHRGADLVVAVLAVLTTGAAFVPLDPDFPAKRLGHICADARPACIVAGPRTRPPAVDAPVVAFEDLQGEESGENGGLPSRGDIAYVLYTSGSTGRPKGVVVDHGNLANLLAGMDESVGISADDRLLAVTSISFDIAVLELLWPLSRGAATVVCPARLLERQAGSRTSFEAMAHRFRPSLFQTTPSFLTALVSRPGAIEHLRGLRALLVGGEAFPTGLARHLLDALPGVRVLNMYGPTETTIWSTVHELGGEAGDASSVPLGRPVVNTELRFVDGLGGDACPGVPCELWIGGAGVARGYLGPAGLGDERFVLDQGRRHYRTGDRVRYGRGGAVEFLGRADRQVKILGHRVELDEVENILSEHPEVESCAVVPRRGPGGLELIAYLVPRPAGPRDEETHLAQWRDVWEARYLDPRERGLPGWVDSYTREPLSRTDMERSLAAIADRVRALGGGRIVDIGAGDGRLAGELAGDAVSYLAVDPSTTALEAARAAVEPLGANARFLCGDALALGELPGSAADVVVLHSVVQYFPDSGYLTRVLDEALRVAGPRGAVLVGDVRDFRLLRMFHTDVQLRRSAPETPAAALAAAVDRLVAAEGELCLSPGHLASVLAHHDGVRVLVDAKGEDVWNEVTRFRWDVTILGRDRPGTATGARTSRVRLPARGAALDAVAGLAHDVPPGECVVVTDVPNGRLAGPAAAVRALAAAKPTDTAWEVARAAWSLEADGDAVNPAEVMERGNRAGVRTRVSPALSGDETRVDVEFHRPDRKESRDPVQRSRTGAAHRGAPG
ncbi:amino acid adenylation domain-containing protein [Lentzea sp.]|uniref:non-ribosomal peptide synthetase n=1 Tax=Lentzea sp. TaxID=56099 RepID=UPI002ED52570